MPEAGAEVSASAEEVPHGAARGLEAEEADQPKPQKTTSAGPYRRAPEGAARKQYAELSSVLVPYRLEETARAEQLPGQENARPAKMASQAERLRKTAR